MAAASAVAQKKTTPASTQAQTPEKEEEMAAEMVAQPPKTKAAAARRFSAITSPSFRGKAQQAQAPAADAEKATMPKKPQTTERGRLPPFLQVPWKVANLSVQGMQAVPAEPEDMKAREMAAAVGEEAAEPPVAQVPVRSPLSPTSLAAHTLASIRMIRYSLVTKSLDDIEAQQKKENENQEQSNRRIVLYTRKEKPKQENGDFDGPPRLRKWFGRQNNYRRTIQNTFKPRASYPSFTRRIPYDANNAAAEDNDNIETTIRQFRNYNNRPERFGRQLMFGPIRKSVVNDTRSSSEGSSSVVFGESLATRPGSSGKRCHDITMKQKKQRDNRVNQNRGIPPPPPPHKMRAAEGKSPNKNRYQVQLRPGSILTVSVANPQISISRQFKRTDGETSFLKDKWGAPKHEKFQPRGISLRYNFRAVANQTKMTLNERFSGLKIIKGNFTVTKSGSRTVTLP
ncbi:uncharacterized protein LOC141549118 isoform X2 [Sminthopsis crassicaudata]|uniref:uncharacterized protein LOC141549118 isoform X2 n=1 Tax=Sminthopsis crassicaudata TaxID=9301 RepID=UPI003D69754C